MSKEKVAWLIRGSWYFCDRPLAGIPGVWRLPSAWTSDKSRKTDEIRQRVQGRAGGVDRRCAERIRWGLRFSGNEWNAVYEGTYLLGTSLARPDFKTNRSCGTVWCFTVSHGATGKGNDQVRFELGYYALNPDIKIIAPWKVPNSINAIQDELNWLNMLSKRNPGKSHCGTALEHWWKPDVYQFRVRNAEDPWQEPKEEINELSQSQKMLRPGTDFDHRFWGGTSGKTWWQEFAPVDLSLRLNEIGGRHGLAE